MLILKYSVAIVISKEIKKVSLFHQIFLLLLLMTGSIFSFTNFNYSINSVLSIICTNIKIVDYIYLYSSIFTLNYDGFVSQIWTNKLLIFISYAYTFSTNICSFITILLFFYSSFIFLIKKFANNNLFLSLITSELISLILYTFSI